MHNIYPLVSISAINGISLCHFRQKINNLKWSKNSVFINGSLLKLFFQNLFCLFLHLNQPKINYVKPLKYYCLFYKFLPFLQTAQN